MTLSSQIAYYSHTLSYPYHTHTVTVSEIHSISAYLLIGTNLSIDY